MSIQATRREFLHAATTATAMLPLGGSFLESTAFAQNTAKKDSAAAAPPAAESKTSTSDSKPAASESKPAPKVETKPAKPAEKK